MNTVSAGLGLQKLYFVEEENVEKMAEEQFWHQSGRVAVSEMASHEKCSGSG